MKFIKSVCLKIKNMRDSIKLSVLLLQDYDIITRLSRYIVLILRGLIYY